MSSVASLSEVFAVLDQAPIYEIKVLTLKPKSGVKRLLNYQCQPISDVSPVVKMDFHLSSLSICTDQFISSLDPFQRFHDAVHDAFHIPLHEFVEKKVDFALMYGVMHE